MRISLDWIKDYIDLAESPEKLKEDLTMVGLMVESISEYEGSAVLELEIAANRPDCLSHVGVAREIAALYRRKLRRVPFSRRLHAREERIPYSVEIAAVDLCPRYVGLVLDGIRVEPSPSWMQCRLQAAGLRPINNIVDITNYVLLDLGHPLHAFDFGLLRGGKIVVERARMGDRFVTLDGIERELDGDMLMIKDGSEPVAIAGVMGGINTEVGSGTHTLLLECAYFQPSSIRQTSRKLGLSTEASYRFERGVDWNGPLPAIARTCYLIGKIAGGKIAGSIRDVYPRRIQPVQIELRRAHAEALLGIELSDDFVVSTLRKLNFRPARTGKGSWKVTCPTYRADMELEADLIEELARHHGYQNIPTTFSATSGAGTPSPVYQCEQAARSILLGIGYSEAVSLSFAAEEERGAIEGAADALRIWNPLTAETEYLRTSLVPGLIRSARRNFNHGESVVRLFELGKVYARTGNAPSERRALAIVGTGSCVDPNWCSGAAGYDFFHLQGAVCRLLNGMRSAPFEILRNSDNAPWLNPADAAALSMGGGQIGRMGSVHPEMAERMRFKQPVYVCEIDFEELTRRVFTPVRFEPLPRYPSIERDISIIVSKDTDYARIRGGILGLGIPELVRMELMDVYEGRQIAPGKVGMLLRFTFRDPEATLTVDRIQAFSDNIRNYLSMEREAEFR